LQYLFNLYPNEIAAVILEPSTHIEPQHDFLKLVSSLCRKHGSIFILDEMITGFRWHLEGAHTMYGVSPDLVTFGKAMANGFSVAALAGRKELMDLGGIKKIGQERVFLMSSTHGAEMSSLGAFNKVLEIYKNQSVIEYLWSYGKKLKDGMNSISKDLGISDYFTVEGVDCSPIYITLNKDKQASWEFRTLFSQEMIKRKILMPWIALSTTHGDRELDMTLSSVREVLAIYKQALNEGFEKYLDSDIIKPVFRKYN
jgi:glutamate-1-semialdehyde 2,1-aminomutase